MKTGVFTLIAVLILSSCSKTTEVPATQPQQPFATAGAGLPLTSSRSMPAWAARDGAVPEPLAESMGGNHVDDSGLVINPSSIEIGVDDALMMLKAAGHDCNLVIAVKHMSDSTTATCSDGERYRLIRILKPKKQDVALKCSAMTDLGIESGC